GRGGSAAQDYSFFANLTASLVCFAQKLFQTCSILQTSCGSTKVNGISPILPSPDVQRLQVPKKSCTINTDATCISEPCVDTAGLVEFSNGSDEDNSSYPDIDYTAPPPPSKFQSLHKMSTCASLDSMIRNVDVITTPRTMQRNMAELEFDWLAAVVERILLIFFMIAFMLTAVGINCVGLYYWWTAEDHIV
ncbi:hypothetical protein OESDEN_08333, partial [Oesophagostomum dentatum]